VKVIRDELAGDPDFRARFSREVAAAKSVSGLFTAPVVDAEAGGPVPWLATAYVAGPSLADAVRQHGPLPAAVVLALAAGLAEGLSAVHAAGLVHRDLKPANVLLAGDGPRLIDFGISRAAEASTLTQSGLVVGSAGFMSPEQAEGREAGPPSDVFSLGAVLAFAATGQGPFGTGSTAALVYRVVHGQPELAAVPAEARALVERCLAKDPSQRPATGELLAELQDVTLAAGWLPAPITGELPEPGKRSGPGPARPATEPAFAPGDLASGQPTVTVAKQQPPSAPAGHAGPATSASGPARGRRRPVALALLAAGVLASAGTAVALHSFTGKAAPGRHSGAASGPPARGAAATPRSPARLDAQVPAAPTDVTASAVSPYTIRVSWAEKGAGITGFNIGNGCGTHGCSGGALNIRTGPVTAASVTTTPGAFQCFYVQAVNRAGISAWAGPGCISTPGLNIPVDREWTDTGVTVRSGAAVGISATGSVYLAAAGPAQTPSGNPSCTPAADYPASSSQFPAPQLPCWSLIARIGNGQPFEVGTSILVTAATGRLYLGVNDSSFSGNTGIWAVKIKIGGLP
jgi:eukaryotic-like serine/threonine-protein kinase